MAIFVLAAAAPAAVWAAEPAGKVLFDAAAPDAAKAVTLNYGSAGDVTFSGGQGGIDVAIRASGKSSFPGIVITPATPWDASGFGHVAMKVTNTGPKPIRINVRIDNEGPWQENRTNGSVMTVKPGQTAAIPAIFGYSYGAPSYPLKPEAIVRAVVYATKSDAPQSFRLVAIEAGGSPGEKPYIDPNSVAVKPAGGVMLGGDVTVTTKQLVTKGGAKATPSDDGKAFAATFSGGESQSVLFKPVAGMWNLNQALEVRVGVKNIGLGPITPSVQLQSRGGLSNRVTAPEPIAPGAEAEIVIPFHAAEPWKGVVDPQQLVLEFKKTWDRGGQPGTGTEYTSNTTQGLLITSEQAGSVQVTSVTADVPPAPELPDWLGKRPPAPGDWTQTFNDNFDGNSIDLHRWNIYTVGDWHIGAMTHYSKDNVIVKDGHLILRLEKKYGHQDDDPSQRGNDYTTGYADTLGKWVQRYGYFEARMKLPRQPDMFLAFWMMPDRGLAAGDEPHRANTKEGGMEFDIMETLSIWGPYRHDLGMHWDGYVKYHKAIGTLGIYVHPDKEGFITCGMLWTPGSVVFYDNGQQVGSWQTPRVSNQPSYFILDLVTGGWEHEPIDDKQLPADFVIDYVRAWQRKDLASAADGPKPNDGGPFPPTK